MPTIELSRLSGPELRQLLKVARARHEGILADSVEWELATRAVNGHGRTLAYEAATAPQRRAMATSIQAILVLMGAGLAVGALATAVVLGRSQDEPTAPRPPPAAVETATATALPAEPVAPALPEPIVTEPPAPATVAPPPRRVVTRAAKPATPAPAAVLADGETSDPQYLARRLETRLREMDAARAAAQSPPPN